MPRKIEAKSQSSVCLGRSAGFTLTEVMFAVILLGIGFIMVAAMFPVALRQAKLSIDETAAAQVGRSAMEKIREIARDNLLLVDPVSGTLVPGAPAGIYSTLPATDGKVQILQNSSFVAGPYGLPAGPNAMGAFAGSQWITWNAIVGNLIDAKNPHYAWTMVYRRDGNPADITTWSNTAQVFIFVVHRPDQPFVGMPPLSGGLPPFLGTATYTGGVPSDLISYVDSGDYFPANLEARPVWFSLTERSTPQELPDLITFYDAGGAFYSPTPTSDPYNRHPYGEGAFVIVGNATNPAAVGRVYRVGARAQDLDALDSAVNADGAAATFELLPGWDMTVTIPPSGIPDNENLPVRLNSPVEVPTGWGGFGYMFGRGYVPEEDWNSRRTHTGINMGVYMYTGFVRVK